MQNVILPADPLVSRYRTIFLSDIHLGCKACQADMLLDFLRHTESDRLYLVGDIVDGWQLKRKWFWPQPHNDVIQKILRKARKGTRVIYVPGNHDEAFRPYEGTHFGGIEVRARDIFTAANRKSYLVIHGDQFDSVILYARWLAYVGDYAYDFAIRINRALNFVRRLLGLRYWSFSSYLKIRVKNAVQFINAYEATVAREAERAGVDGVICGHIHHAEIKRFGEIEYMNDGDWVESCTALVEHYDGRFEILNWPEIKAARTTLGVGDKIDEPVSLPPVTAAASTPERSSARYKEKLLT